MKSPATDTMPPIPSVVDVVIIGSGMAGLVTSLLIRESLRVLVITKKGRADSNTNFAQGGIAAAVGSNDTPELHLTDTLRGGVGLCHKDIVRLVVEEGPGAVTQLQHWGVPFSRGGDDEWDLGREGGHSRRRIVHALDRTGMEIEKTLLARLKEKTNLDLVENVFVSQLTTDVHRNDSISVCGVELVDDRRESTFIRHVVARSVVIAAGGAGRVYLYTSNPEIATGDGISLGFNAGVPVRNLEFVQFHPTTLYGFRDKPFLISEAVRGEGAKLILPDGSRFMDRYDKRAELAPRDIVARAIDNEMKERGLEHVYLDATRLDASFIKKRFPQIYQNCLHAGIDITDDPIPVVPAAHYMCGGLATDRDGKTRVRGLYACGEVSHTGLHGANRLASNSLLEAVVFARRVAKMINDQSFIGLNGGSISTERPVIVGATNEANTIGDLRSELQLIMWQGAGIVRTDKGLRNALARIRDIGTIVNELKQIMPMNREVMELDNMIVVAELIARSASWRKESRGLHFNRDHSCRGRRGWRKDSEIQPVVGS